MIIMKHVSLTKVTMIAITLKTLMIMKTVIRTISKHKSIKRTFKPSELNNVKSNREIWV